MPLDDSAPGDTSHFALDLNAVNGDPDQSLGQFYGTLDGTLQYIRHPIQRRNDVLSLNRLNIAKSYVYSNPRAEGKLSFAPDVKKQNLSL